MGTIRETPSPHGVSFTEALRFWIKLGFISFGGPAGQIAIMHRELVERRRWISEERFLHALNYCMILPGPEAQQLATYIGWLLHRTPGGILAGSLFVIPSIFVLLALSYVYAIWGDVSAVAGVLAGFKPVVVAVVVEAVLRIGRRAIRRRAHLAIAAAAFVAIYFLHVPFPLIVLSAALLGLLGERLWPASFEAAPAVQEDAAATDSVLCENGPPAVHMIPSRRRTLRVIASGIGLWLIPLAAIVAARGWRSLYAEEYRFFTKAAFVTFGGAYAVLAYVTQVAGEGYGWITHAQAVDGLALAETTPGPLIMVLQFIGFMAGWSHPEGMPRGSSGLLGALVTTWTTFLPSILFILIGAPYIEQIRGNRHLSAALTGVTAAVVGVILNLAMIFGAAVILPRGLGGPPDAFALLLAAAAFVALFRYRADLLRVIVAGGAVGLVRRIVFG